MEKTYYRFLCVELLERLVRFEGLLNNELTSSPDKLSSATPSLVDALQERLQFLQQAVLQEKELLVSLLSDAASTAKLGKSQLPSLLDATYRGLSQLSQVALSVDSRQVQAETHLFLKDALPEALTCKAGHYSVVMEAEGHTGNVERLAREQVQLRQVLLAGLSSLQRHNPLGWLGLAQPLTEYFSRSEASFKPVRTKLSEIFASSENADTLLSHCLALRLLGPAYYFHSAAEAALRQDAFYLNWVEPALFYGLQHFNFAHNQLVILHEALERAAKEKTPDKYDKKERGQESADFKGLLAELFRTVEKVIPDWQAFSEKHFERAQALKERLGEGVLLSSASVFPVSEVSAHLAQKQADKEFAIYDALSMMTEYPYTPREIVNAGWLHKVERGPIWLFAALQDAQPFAKFYQLLSTQDHLLSKSIETSEVHRVLLCTP